MLDKLTQFTGGLQERLQTYGLNREEVSRVVRSRAGVRHSAAATGLRTLLQTEGPTVQGEIPAEVVQAPAAPAPEQPAIANFKLPDTEPDVPTEVTEPVSDETTARIEAARNLVKEQYGDAA